MHSMCICLRRGGRVEVEVGGCGDIAENSIKCMVVVNVLAFFWNAI